MNFIDTHAHINLDNKIDTDNIIKRSLDAGVSRIIIANVDSQSIESMMSMVDKYPDVIVPMMGLHPTSVKGDFEKELDIIESWLDKYRFNAVGEIGLDLYWDKTYFEQQKVAFKRQYQLAKQHNLPINIHVRNAFDELFDLFNEIGDPQYYGILHCFSGNQDQAERCIDLGLKLAIGGVVTFKNGGLDKVVKNIPLEHLVLETDSPWLAPAPYRGKTNEPSYIPHIAQKIADIHEVSIEEVAKITTENAKSIFSI